MQSGKPKNYPKLSKLHQFVYIIELNHQKKSEGNRRKFGISASHFSGGMRGYGGRVPMESL